MPTAKAKKLTLRCLALVKQDDSSDQLAVAQQIGDFGALYQSEHALDLFERGGGANTTENAFVLHNLSSLRMAAGKPVLAADAERAVAIWGATLGTNHPVYAQGPADLAHLNAMLGHVEESEALWNRSFSIVEKTLGPNHPTYGRLLQAYAGALDRRHHKVEAKRFESGRHRFWELGCRWGCIRWINGCWRENQRATNEHE
jgi:hypothetical protein